MNVLLVDNYDSFTYNIAHMVRECPGVKLTIIRAGEVEVNSLGSFDRIIFSPGPDLPRPGNIMELILRRYEATKPILGICLGLQAIYLYYGGKLQQLDEVVHGRTKNIIVTGNECRLFRDTPDKFSAGLYHSWIADSETLPASIEITAVSEENRIMAISHISYKIEAVQFHPESIMTPYGSNMINSWLSS